MESPVPAVTWLHQPITGGAVTAAVVASLPYLHARQDDYYIVYYVIVICSLDPSIEATACACKLLYVWVIFISYICGNVHFLSRHQIVMSNIDGPMWLQIGGEGGDLLSGCQHDGTVRAGSKCTWHSNVRLTGINWPVTVPSLLRPVAYLHDRNCDGDKLY